jgi:hypothetical protein
VKAGDKVYIRYNPHRSDVEGIVGVVERFEPGSGFMGCDLAYVRYADPWTGEEETMPFATSNLNQGSREAILAVAERMERQAAMLREIAG